MLWPSACSAYPGGKAPTFVADERLTFSDEQFDAVAREPAVPLPIRRRPVARHNFGSRSRHDTGVAATARNGCNNARSTVGAGHRQALDLRR
jgi:hypothetical protein